MRDPIRPLVREGVFDGGLPYLVVGSGTPLVYLRASTPNHRNPAPGVERWLALRTVQPVAAQGFEVYYTNRWPGMPADITWAEVAAGTARALRAHFGGPVDVLGHSTGGSLALQLAADHPTVVRRAVVAAAAYRLGPVARRSQRALLRGLQQTGSYTPDGLLAMVGDEVPWPTVRAVLRPAAGLVARRIRVDRSTDAIAMLQAEDRFDLRDRLPEIGTETLVICGAQDRNWTLEEFAETAYRMPRGRLVMYPDLGHGLVTSPRFVADVTAFLTGDGRPGRQQS